MNEPAIDWREEDARPRHIEIHGNLYLLGAILVFVLLTLIQVTRLEAEIDERNDRLKLPTERHGRLDPSLFP